MSVISLNTISRSKGALVTLGTVVALVVGLAVTLFGSGAAKHAVASFDGGGWLWSTSKGEVARVNGVTGRVDTRYKVTDGQGHTMSVSQNDRYVILRDLTTGKISVLDLASLRIGATTQTTAGLGVTVALGEHAAFIIDTVQGAVRQLDPATLSPVGAHLSFPPGIGGGAFDSEGRLWILNASEGTATAIQPAKIDDGDEGSDRRGDDGRRAAGDDKTGDDGSRRGGDPKIVKTITIADPSHELALSVLDSGVAVLDKTATTLITVRGDHQRSIKLPLNGPGALPIRTVGPTVPVTVVDDRRVYVVNGDKIAEFTVPGASPKLQPCTAWTRRLYCPDDATGTVYVLDEAGALAGTVAIPNSGGALELEVREAHLFINAPGSANARVVDDRHRVKVVDKYVSDVLGAEPPPQIPPTPPTVPPVGPPGPPVNVKATAGNAMARVSWGAAAPNGAPIMKYVVEGGDKPREVGANQRSIDIPGLTNGQQYTFTVYAVNAKGNGPKRASNPVVPTAEVPEAPASVTAEAKPDGTVAVTWPAANGLGNKITRYDVTAIASGQQDPVGGAEGTAFTVPAGKLTYGTQYGFTVVAVSEKGASSKASPVSNTVVPFTTPGKPTVTATTAGDKKGAVNVSWTAPAENGRPITKYVVSGGGVSQEVTGGRSTTLTGLATGATVTVSVRAINAAGEGPPGTAAATTVAQPTVTLAGATGAQTSITVKFTANTGGASGAECSVTVEGKSAVTGACGSITVGGLLPSTSYRYTVTVKNPAGTATASGTQATQDVTGVAYCTTTSDDPDYKAWCVTGQNALEVQTSPAKLHQGQVGRTTHGQTYKAYCYTTGDQVYAYAYNHDKKTNIWVKIDWGGQQLYTPLAWFNVGGDWSVTTGALPHC